MLFFILIVCFFIFLFCLYKLTKDDYLFIRKNIYPEQVFDIIFLVVWFGLFIARLVSFIQHPVSGKNVFAYFFSIRSGGFSLSGGVTGSLLALLLMAKYKKVPLGRLFDFFSLAFLFTLPVGFTGYALLLRSTLSLLFFAVGLLYLTILVIFLRFLYPRIMNRSLREGSLSSYFLMFFSIISFLTMLLAFGKISEGHTFFTPDTILLLCLFSTGLGLTVQQERKRLKGRRIRR